MKEIIFEDSVYVFGFLVLCMKDIIVWMVWSDLDKWEFIGCGVIKEIGFKYGEIKVMCIVEFYLCCGVVSVFLCYMINEVCYWLYVCLSLEMGFIFYFVFVWVFYVYFGFIECGFFDGYLEDLYSIFMIWIGLGNILNEEWMKVW